MQLARGESLADTARVLSRHVAAVGVRTGPDELLEELAADATLPVFNMLTARPPPVPGARRPADAARGVRRLEGLKLAYVGDGNNVARSLALVGRDRRASRSRSRRRRATSSTACRTRS